MFTMTVDEEIHLRTIHPDDSEVLFKLMEQNRPRLRPWIHPSVLPETIEEARRYTIECFFYSLDDPFDAVFGYPEYLEELGGYFPPSYLPIETGIWVHEDLAGVISISRLKDSFTAAKFGYWLAQEYEGRGVVSCCVGALMNYAIENMGIERFVIECAANNQRSRAVAERLGYRLHTIQPNSEVVGEFVYNKAIYGIRSKTWQENQEFKP